MSHGRTVDTDSPAYRGGVKLANDVLDAGAGMQARDWADLAEAAADLAHQTENVPAYHAARGFGDTMREYLQGQD